MLNLNDSAGSNIRWISSKIDKLSINTSHWLGQAHLRGGTHNWSGQPIEELLNKTEYTSTTNLKRRLIKNELLPYKCHRCGITEWLSEPLSLQLHHEDGNRKNNKLNNLQLLCPNCHSQTSNFCSHNNPGKEIFKPKIIRTPIPPNICLCGKRISKKSTSCKSCAGKDREQTKIVWPSIEELTKMLKDSNYLALGKKLGVSDNAIRKRIKKHSAVGGT